MDAELKSRLEYKYKEYSERLRKIEELLGETPQIPTATPESVVEAPCWFCKLKRWIKTWLR